MLDVQGVGGSNPSGSTKKNCNSFQKLEIWYNNHTTLIKGAYLFYEIDTRVENEDIIIKKMTSDSNE